MLARPPPPPLPLPLPPLYCARRPAGVSKFLLHDVIEDDWPELVKSIGHRVVLRTAAAEMYSRAELANLQAATARIRASTESIQAEGDIDRATFTRAQVSMAPVSPPPLHNVAQPNLHFPSPFRLLPHFLPPSPGCRPHLPRVCPC